MKLTLTIEPDTDASNPRKEWDNAATMLCAHRRYDLGDEQTDGDGIAEKVREVEKAGGVWLPLYLYDHSGITMRTGPFGCPWDSGQVGIIYMMPEKGREEFGRVWRKRSIALMESEVKVYDQYLTGDVYGVVIKDENGETVESCWGFFGQEYAEEEGERMLKDAQENTDDEEAREAVNAHDAACRDIATA